MVVGFDRFREAVLFCEGEDAGGWRQAVCARVQEGGTGTGLLFTNHKCKSEMKLSEVYEETGMMGVGIFIQSSRFWRDLDENPARND